MPRRSCRLRSGAHACLDAERRHRLFPRRRRPGTGPPQRPEDDRLRRFAVCALPGQVPLRRGAAGARPSRAAMRAGARRRLAGRAAGLAGRLVRQAEPARRQDRHLAGFALPESRPCAGAQPPGFFRLSRRCRRAALCRRAAMSGRVSSAVEPEAGVEALGVVFVDSGGDFQTMDDSLALYGETGAAAKARAAMRSRTCCRWRQRSRPPPSGSADRRPADAGAWASRRVFARFQGRGGRHRAPHRIRGMPGPALLRLPRLLPLAMGPRPGRRDGRNAAASS